MFSDFPGLDLQNGDEVQRPKNGFILLTLLIPEFALGILDGPGIELRL